MTWLIDDERPDGNILSLPSNYYVPILVVHLVKLIDHADTAIRQHQRTTLQRELTRHRIPITPAGG